MANEIHLAFEMPYHISLSSSPSFTLLLILANPDNGLIQLMKVDLLDGLYKIDLISRGCMMLVVHLNRMWPMNFNLVRRMENINLFP